MDLHRLDDRFSDRHARVQGGIGVLENDLEVLSDPPQILLGHPSDILPFKEDPPTGGIEEPKEGPSQRGLSTAGFSNEPERFPRVDIEAHIVHRLHVVLGLPEKALPDREPGLHILELKERFPRIDPLMRLIALSLAHLQTLHEFLHALVGTDELAFLIPFHEIGNGGQSIEAAVQGGATGQ